MGSEILSKRADETTAKLKEMTSTVEAKVRGWLLLTAVGVGAAAGFMGGAFVLVLHGGQLALAPWLGAVGAPLALGGTILAALAFAAWWATRPKAKKKAAKAPAAPAGA